MTRLLPLVLTLTSLAKQQRMRVLGRRLINYARGKVSGAAAVLLLVPVVALAEWVPSGRIKDFNADLNRTRTVSGGPSWNYLDGATWRKINTDWRQQGQSLISDSSFHKVQTDGERIRMKWGDFIIKQRIDSLYAYRRSTHQRVALAGPDFSNKTFSGNTVTLTNCYPGVDVKIINEPDQVSIKYIFHDAFRTTFENWWQANGAPADAYVVTLIQLDVDSLGLQWRDSMGTFDLNTSRDLEGVVPLTLNDVAQFFLTRTDYRSGNNFDRLYQRIIRNGPRRYLAEGFPWAVVRTWSAGDIEHTATFGETPTASEANWGSTGVTQTMPETTDGTGGVADSVDIRVRNGGTNDVIHGLIYTSSGGEPGTLVDSTASLTITSNTQTVYTLLFENGVTLSASTEYYIGMINTSTNSIINSIASSGGPGVTYRQGTTSIQDPFGTKTGTDANYMFYCLVYYEVGGGGGGDDSYTRRTRLLRGSIEQSNLLGVLSCVVSFVY